MKSLGLVCAIFVVTGGAGCSLPAIGSGSSAPAPAPNVAAIDTPADAPPIVQVREYWHSSVISVVAWDATDAAFGLRTSVSRTGKLVGGQRLGDHRLYMTPLLVRDMGGFKYATVAPDEFLLGTGAERDSYSCFYGRNCSPMTTVGVRLPDSVLRANRDSLIVTFFPRVHERWTLTLRRELIAAYLNKVDSIVAVSKRTGSL